MNQALGIIDRGVGGLGLYKNLRTRSDRPLIYFADNGNIPYGLIEKSELKDRLNQIIDHLNSVGASKVVLACNSASVVYPDNACVKGMIEFGVASLLNARANRPALMATKGTVESGAYREIFEKRGLAVHERIAQPLALYVEQGNLGGEDVVNAVRDIMRPLEKCDAILLACTHFPAIKPVIQRFAQTGCQLIDPAKEMADWLERNWLNDENNGSIRNTQFIVTGSADAFIRAAKTAFDVQINPNQVSTITF